MRHLLQILIAITMIWCGAHWCGEEQAQEPSGGLAFLLDDHLLDDSDDTDTRRGVAHGGHHHCPLAIEQRSCGARLVCLTAGDPVTRTIRALIAHSSAPLLEPPSA